MRAGLHAEQAILGAVLLDGGTLPRVRALLPGPEAFAQAHHRAIWQAVLAVDAAGTPVALVNVAEYLEARERLSDLGGVAYLSELVANTLSAANVESYAATVALEARRRAFCRLLDDARERMETGEPDVIAGELQAALGKVERSEAGTYDALALVEEGFARLHAPTSSLLATGLEPLDRALGGFEPGRLYVIAGRTGKGKTALSLAIAHHFATGGVPVGLCSLEMPVHEIFNRLAAHRYGINLTAITRRMGNTPRELDDAYQHDPLSHLQLWVDDSTTELSGLVARALEWHYRHQIGALFVDYLGLIRVRGDAPRHERIGECSRAFKLLAKRLQIPVVVACQFNRENERDDRRPRPSDLRDSGSIEQDADAIIALHPTSDPDHGGRLSVELGVLKNRSGSAGWLPDAITFDGRTQRFLVDGEGSGRGKGVGRRTGKGSRDP